MKQPFYIKYTLYIYYSLVLGYDNIFILTYISVQIRNNKKGQVFCICLKT